MTNSTAPVDIAPAKPTGLKAKAGDVGLKVYLKAPPPAQEAMLKGYTQAQKVAPHAKKIVAGGVGLLVLRKLRHRRH
jgi:hypothetical protein